jgi:hypothetical protein
MSARQAHNSQLYKVVQIWPGLFVCKQVTVCPGHIWTTLYLQLLELPFIIGELLRFTSFNLSVFHDASDPYKKKLFSVRGICKLGM